jgi:NAD(P)-dependent dehydrogenase (short-subunit alcohol dehydrogenase family)
LASNRDSAWRDRAAVAITARRESWLTSADQTLASLGIQCLATPCDVSQPDQVSAAVAGVLERFGRIDILVNNAGISWGEPVETMPVEKWRAVLDTNVTGCFLMSRAVGDVTLIRGGGSAIVNIASIAALVGRPSMSSTHRLQREQGPSSADARPRREMGAHGIRSTPSQVLRHGLTTGVLDAAAQEISLHADGTNQPPQG